MLIFFFTLFFFLLFWLVVFCFLCSKSLIWFSASSTLLFFPCKLFFISVSVSFVSDWIYFMLLRSSLSSLSILITSVLNSASGRLLTSILFIFFLEFCSVLSFGQCFFVSFWQPTCVCFYVLGRSDLILYLSIVAYYRKVHLYVGWGWWALGNHQGGAIHVNQVNDVSDMVLLLCDSVWGRAQKVDNAAAWPLEFCPGTLIHARQFNFSLYATGALPAAVTALETRGSESL